MPQHVPSPPSAPLAHSSTKKSPFRRSHPLTTNPELEVLSYDLSSESTVHEYRVCSFRTLRTGRRVQRGGSVALDGLIVALLAVAWRYGAGKALTALSWTDGSLADVVSLSFCSGLIDRPSLLSSFCCWPCGYSSSSVSSSTVRVPCNLPI